MKKRFSFLGFLFLLNFIVISVIFSSPVYADIPDVVTVEPLIRGNEIVLNITIKHEFPTFDHYIDLIQIDVDGTITDHDLERQTTTYFIVEYSLGELTDEPSVQVRAHCTFHGWGDWSSAQIIPEFASWIVLPLFLIGTLAVLELRKKMKD